VLFCHKLYFEFIKDTEIELQNPRIYHAHELEIGVQYCILVTNPAGLYRYNMNDIVKVTGKYNDFPTIQFIQKTNGIISLTGEKLSERQFIYAVNETENELQLSLRFFVAFADVNQSAYHVYYEFAQDSTVPAEEAQKFTRLVDEKIKAVNREYQEKRDSNRLNSPVTHFLQKESFETFKAICIDLGYRDGQFKLNLLMQDEKRHAIFKQLEVSGR
jgi:hypothetical protein